MITMEPTLRTGLAGRDRQILPDDEFEARVRNVRALMTTRGVDALIVTGSAACGGAFTYLTGAVPWTSWAAVVVPRDGEPVLVSAVGPREKAVIAAQNWIRDIRTPGAHGEGVFSAVLEGLAATVAKDARIGVAGADEALDSDGMALMRAALAPFFLVEFDAPLQELMRVKRPRELQALGSTLRLAERAVAAGASVFSGGADTARAARAADAAARGGGAHDVRILADLLPGALGPLDRMATSARREFSLYCAVETSGYWANAAVTAVRTGYPRENTAIAAMRDRLRDGIPAAAVAEAGLRMLDAEDRHKVLLYGLGAGIGLRPQEVPIIAPDSKDMVRAGDVICLRVISPRDDDSLCGALTVRVHDSGCEPL